METSASFEARSAPLPYSRSYQYPCSITFDHQMRDVAVMKDASSEARKRMA